MFAFLSLLLIFIIFFLLCLVSSFHIFQLLNWCKRMHPTNTNSRTVNGLIAQVWCSVFFNASSKVSVRRQNVKNVKRRVFRSSCTDRISILFWLSGLVYGRTTCHHTGTVHIANERYQCVWNPYGLLAPVRGTDGTRITQQYGMLSFEMTVHAHPSRSSAISASSQRS